MWIFRAFWTFGRRQPRSALRTVNVRSRSARCIWDVMKRRVGLGCAGLVVLSVGAYLAAHRREPEPPRWTELDVAVPTDDNGWSELARHGIAPVPDPLFQEVIRPMSQAIPQSPEWYALHARLDEGIDASSIDSSAELRAAIAEHEHFFDGCPLHFDTTCSLMDTTKLWNHYQLEILITRDPAVASTIWRRAADFTRMCRTIVACILGVELLKRTLRVSRWLLYPLSDGLETLRETLRDFELPRDLFQRAIIGDYIEKHALLVSDEMPLLADRAQTLRFLTRDYESIHAFAARDGTPRPVERRYAEGTLWWVYNHEGKSMLAMLGTLTMLGDYVERYDEEVEELHRARLGLLEQMRRVMASD